MTAPQTHPDWCGRDGLCTAYQADPDLVRIHRSRPIILDLFPSDALVMYLAQPVEFPETTVELVVFEPPVPTEHYRVESLVWLTLPIGRADAVRHALASLIRAAVTS